jgi:hypothetical protein
MNAISRLAFLSVLSSLTLTACSTMKMKVDPQLADDQRMAVKRKGIFHGGDLSFGEFRAAGVDRGWTHSDSTSIFNQTDTSSSQKYEFAFKSGDNVTDQVRCETVYAERARSYGRLRIDNGRHGLGCLLADQDGRPRGELVMMEHERHRPSGRMYLDTVAMDVIPRMRGEGARWDTLEPVGYELRIDGQVVGAVQTINGGAVWIEASLPAELRQAAALASATLLLYQPIDG